MSLSPQALRTSLVSRGMELNPPASTQQLALLAAVTGGTMHPYNIGIYACFNGTTDGFDRSMPVHIWPIAEIAAARPEYFSNENFPFADFLMGSEIFVSKASRPDEPVIAYVEGRVVAPSIYEFWSMLAGGAFAF